MTQKSDANVRLLSDATSQWRGHEGLKWVESGHPTGPLVLCFIVPSAIVSVTRFQGDC